MTCRRDALEFVAGDPCRIGRRSRLTANDPAKAPRNASDVRFSPERTNGTRFGAMARLFHLGIGPALNKGEGVPARPALGGIPRMNPSPERQSNHLGSLTRIVAPKRSGGDIPG